MNRIKVLRVTQDKVDALPERQRDIYERIIKLIQHNWAALDNKIDPIEGTTNMYILGITDVQLAVRFSKNPPIPHMALGFDDPDFIVTDVIYPVKKFDIPNDEQPNCAHPALPKRKRLLSLAKRRVSETPSPFG